MAVPNISLLEPMVLRGVVEKFTVPESLVMLNRLDQTPWPWPYATWDVIKGSRMMAAPNVPNAEAHIVSRLGRSQETASFVYLREKKIFEPTTLHWLRVPGELARVNAEQSVLREVNDLNQRFDNFAEWLIWQAMGGSIVFQAGQGFAGTSGPPGPSGISSGAGDVQATVDFKFPSSHFVQPAVPWLSNSALAWGTTGTGPNTTLNQANTNLQAGGGTIAYATPMEIVEDIRSWKRIVQIHGRVPATEVFATSVTLAAMFEAWVQAGQGSTVNIPATMLSDRMKDEYYSSGTLSGFLGLTWNTVEEVYENSSGVLTFFVPDGMLYMGNYSDQRPMELLIGPTADDEAPDGFTGKYAKTWKEKDPSARQYLLEWNLLPIVTRPEQMLVVDGIIANNTTTTTYAGGAGGSLQTYPYYYNQSPTD
jgi:Phage major capsid protein E